MSLIRSRTWRIFSMVQAGGMTPAEVSTTPAIVPASTSDCSMLSQIAAAGSSHVVAFVPPMMAVVGARATRSARVVSPKGGDLYASMADARSYTNHGSSARARSRGTPSRWTRSSCESRTSR